jgi:hypothetical protein
MLDTGVAAAGADVLVQVGHRLGDAGVVGGQHRPAYLRVSQAVEDGDALRGPQHHIERRDRVAAVGAAEELAGVGVAALEHPPEAPDRCFAFQPE